MVKQVKFKSSLHEKIYNNSESFVIKLQKTDVNSLKASTSKLLTINKIKFQLAEIDSEFFLFRSLDSSIIKEFKYEGGLFYVNNTSFKVLNLYDIAEEETSVEHIDVSGLKDISVKTHVDVEIAQLNDLEGKDRIINHLDSPEPYTPVFDDGSKNLDFKDLSFIKHVDFNKPSGFWFSLVRNFEKSTEDFWLELEYYYKDSPDKLKVLVKDSSSLPVFSKIDARFNTSSLHLAIVSKVSDRILELENNKELLGNQLLELESDLIRFGISPKEDSSFGELTSERKAISECLAKAKSALDRYSSQLKKLEETAGSASDKFLIDVRGFPQKISKYYEKVMDKLIEVNLEINSIYRYHQEIEHALIKRLKDINSLKDIEDRLREFERNEILKDYIEGNKEAIERADKQESLRVLGELNESTAFINKKVEEEKSKIRYYLNNLNDIAKYENYELSLFEHRKRKRQLRKDTLDFRRRVYELKLLIQRREQKKDAFSKNVYDSIFAFKKEVLDTCKRHDDLADTCLSKWFERWNMEAIPSIEDVYSRSDQIIESFSPIPSIQIKKLYQLQKNLKAESDYRQAEWDRIYEHIQQEFKDMGYEREYPRPSELDVKYLDMIDSSELKLSDITNNALFAPLDSFYLSSKKDVVIGLDPKVLDDNNFVVIDQVWSTLTSEQEEIAKEKMMRDQLDEKLKNIKTRKEDLQANQLRKIKNRFSTKTDSVDKTIQPFTSYETFERFKDIEESELKIWKEDNYLISNSKGEFRDLMYRITKKLFSTKSVRVVNNSVEFTDDGFVRDGGTEIMSAKDYFLKSPSEDLFTDSHDHLDLNTGEDIHVEPDDKFLESLADPEYVGNVSAIQKKSVPEKPSVFELAQISIKKFREEKSKGYELSILKEKLLELDDEIKKVKDYHEKVGSSLDKAISERWEVFEDMQNHLGGVKSFLDDKDDELNRMFGSAEQDLNVKLKEVESETRDRLQANRKTLPTRKKGFIYWFNKIIYGERVDEENNFPE